MEVRDEAMDLLCMACLCVGRTLRKITDEKLKQYYMETLNEIPLCITSQVVPVVCWECEAMLRKVTVFKEQVKDSYRILQTYTKENLHECLITEIGRPPRLKIHHNEHNIVVIEDENPPQGVKCESNTGESIHGNHQLYEKPKRHFVGVANICDNVKENTQNSPLTEVRRSRLTQSSQVKVESEESRLNGSHSAEEPKVQEIVTVLCGAQKNRRKDCHPKPERNGVDTLAIEEYEVEIFGPVESRDQGGGSDDCADAFGRSDSDVDLSTTKTKVKEKQPERTKVKSVKKKKNEKDSNNSSQKIKSLELSYEDMQAERTRRAHRRSFVSAQHKCGTCLVVFDCAAAQRAHDKSKHSPELGEYICPICYIIVGTVESFTAHYKRHIRRYQCSVCSKRTLDLKTMNRHLLARHGQKTRRKRREILKDCSEPGRDSPKGRVECGDCDKTFSHRAGLLNHRLAVHESQNEFPCSACDKVFRWKTSLKRHLEKHQAKGMGGMGSGAGGGAYCDACDIAFSSVCSLQRHLRNSLKHVTQDQLKFICEHCNKRFADKTKLRNHIEEKHLHWTYTCHICSKPSKNRVGLEQHVRNVHKGRPHNKICQHCGKGFPTKVQLESHIRTHTGERPFICEFCPTTFSQQSNLYKHHRQVHLNIKSKRYPAICKKRRSDEDPPAAPPPHEDLPVPPLLYYENILGV